MSASADPRPAAKIRTAPFHHFVSVLERPLVEERLHSSRLTMVAPGIRLDGARNQARLVEIIEVGPGRWLPGGHQPVEVSVGMMCYVKERAIPFRVNLRQQDHFYVAADCIMAELDIDNLKLRPVGDWIVVRENEERARIAVMGDLPFHLGQVTGTGKDGQEADDIGAIRTRMGEVVAVGPGRFNGFQPRIVIDQGSPIGFRIDQQPMWQTPGCKVGDLILYSCIARPTNVTLAGKVYTLLEFDHAVCGVADE